MLTIIKVFIILFLLVGIVLFIYFQGKTSFSHICSIWLLYPNFYFYLVPIFQPVKIYQILHVISETTSQFSFNFCINPLMPLNVTPIYFFSSNIIYFGQRQPIIGQIFEIFVCSGQNSLNFSCKF